MAAQSTAFDLFKANIRFVDPGNAGSIYVDRSPCLCEMVSAGAETRTMARPTKSGAIISVYAKTVGGTITLTVTGGFNQAGDTTFAFTAVGQFAVFQSFVTTAGVYFWQMISSYTGTSTGGAVTFPSTVGITGVTTPTGGIAAAGGFSATPCGQINTGGYPAIVSTYGTDSTPTTTSVYVVEIFVPCNMTITGVNYLNGSAVGNGTVRIGLYTSAGVAIAAALTAATTTAGIDSYQAVAFATPYAAVGPAKYLIGFQFSSGTDRYNTHISGFTQGFGIAQASATVGVTAISPVPTAVVAGAAVVASLY